MFATYNFPGKSRAFCRKHALPGMVSPPPDIRRTVRLAPPWCKVLLLLTRAKPRAWRTHLARNALSPAATLLPSCCPEKTLFCGMQEDVISPRCDEDGCRKVATFGHPGGRRARCNMHKLEDMVGCSLRVQLLWLPPCKHARMGAYHMQC